MLHGRVWQSGYREVFEGAVVGRCSSFRSKRQPLCIDRDAQKFAKLACRQLSLCSCPK
jgi:hypothetical protein